MLKQKPRVLISVRVLEGEIISDGLVNFLSNVRVVILGYHVLPEQTAPGQAKMQFGDRAKKSLQELKKSFENNEDVETRLIFTHDREKTFERIADETNCIAFLIPNPKIKIEKILVPIRETSNVENIISFVGSLISNKNIHVKLFSVIENEEDNSIDTEKLIKNSIEILEKINIRKELISQEVVTSSNPINTIIEESIKFDAVVMGETQPSFKSLVFGETSEKIAKESLGPVIAVRKLADKNKEKNG